MDLHQKCTDSPNLIYKYDYKNNIYVWFFKETYWIFSPSVPQVLTISKIYVENKHERITREILSRWKMYNKGEG